MLLEQDLLLRITVKAATGTIMGDIWALQG